MNGDNKTVVAIILSVSLAIVLLALLGKGCTEAEFDRDRSITIHALEKGCSVVANQVVCPCK